MLARYQRPEVKDSVRVQFCTKATKHMTPNKEHHYKTKCLTEDAYYLKLKAVSAMPASSTSP